MYLTGAKLYNLDAKARLTLPADIRKEFTPCERVCLVPLSEAVYGFTPEGHKAWVDSFFPDGFNPRNRKHDALRRQLTSRTVSVDIDSAGRVCLSKLSATDREKLGLSKEVMVVGNDDHFEIWNPSAWEKTQQDLDEDLEALMFDEG